MKKKLEIAALGSGLVMALAVLLGSESAYSQQVAKVARVGFLSLAAKADDQLAPSIANAMKRLGYVEGKSVVFEYRYANFQPERLTELAEDLVRQKVEVIVAITNIPGFAARKASDRVPIVVWGIHGAVETGLVRSLARPGGNVTGIDSLAPKLDAKRLELIKQLVPTLSRLGVVYNADDQGAPVHLLSLRGAARVLDVGISPLAVKRPEDFEGVLSSAAGASLDGVLMFTDDLTAVHWGKILDFASKHQLPTVCEIRSFVQLGCLLSYGPSIDEFTRRVVQQVDKILKGAKPGDLPVEQVTRFELLVNKKTAKALGITIPHSVLMKATELIE